MQVTLYIDDTVYHEAVAAAAGKGITLAEFIEEALRLMLDRATLKTSEMTEEGSDLQREEFARFLDELDAKPLKDGPSVGPLNREELYQRGTQAEPKSPVAPETAEDENFRKRREDLARFFAELNGQPRQEGPSVGPLNREELYQRGAQSAEQAEAEANRTAFLEQLHHLVEQSLERDRLKEGRLVPLTREEIYAERLDRFR
jgi:hypothetical protein